MDAAVITIPASFDTVQSNATKEAGAMAGFKAVILLQEPIAASVAYTNKERNIDLKNSLWMMYDLGGGTFDVALIRIVEGELTVVDHEGDHYLGGYDFDALMVEKVVVSTLEKKGKFDDLLGQMKSEGRRVQPTLACLDLLRSGGKKIGLSTRTAAEIDAGPIRNLEDDEGNTINSILTVSRSDFEAVIRDGVESTIEMMKKISVRNSLAARQDLQFILMVGGSTYIPYVRKRVEEVMGIPVNPGIDPPMPLPWVQRISLAARNFVSIVAKRKRVPLPGALHIRVPYNRTSQEQEEPFAARVEGDTAGMQSPSRARGRCL